MSMLTRGRSRLAALGTAGALTVSALALTPPAHAAETGVVEGGSLTWGLSTYLNGGSMGSPGPLASGYVPPATFNAATKLATFPLASVELAADGSAEIAFDGASLNYAPTGNRWLKLEDPIVDVDSAGNGELTALVSYGPGVGTVYPDTSYDPTVPAFRGPTRVPLVDLVGNTGAAVSVATDISKWTNLAGTWAPELITFLTGDPDAEPVIPGLSYRSQLTNTPAANAPSPVNITVDRVAPKTVATVTSFTKDYLDIAISGTGFKAQSGVQRISNGIYVGLAPSGGILGIGAGGAAEGMASMPASDHVAKEAIVDGAFSRALTAETAKLTRTTSYSIYTWSAHGNPVAGDSQMTETPISIDWSSIEEPQPAKVAPKVTAKVQKAPTTRKAGKAVVAVKGSEGAGTGKVRLQVIKGKKVVKKLGAVKLKKGKATVKLPKSKRGSYKLKASYLGDTSYKAKATTVKFTVRKR